MISNGRYCCTFTTWPTPKASPNKWLERPAAGHARTLPLVSLATYGRSSERCALGCRAPIPWMDTQQASAREQRKKPEWHRKKHGYTRKFTHTSKKWNDVYTEAKQQQNPAKKNLKQSYKAKTHPTHTLLIYPHTAQGYMFFPFYAFSVYLCS